jgi:hypothetical protein
MTISACRQIILMGEDTERGRKRGREDDLLSMKMYEAI